MGIRTNLNIGFYYIQGDNESWIKRITEKIIESS